MLVVIDLLLFWLIDLNWVLGYLGDESFLGFMYVKDYVREGIWDEGVKVSYWELVVGGFEF